MATNQTVVKINKPTLEWIREYGKKQRPPIKAPKVIDLAIRLLATFDQSNVNK